MVSLGHFRSSHRLFPQVGAEIADQIGKVLPVECPDWLTLEGGQKPKFQEWACAGLDDGFANRYTLTTDGLLFLDLSQPPYTILNWLAMLVENRRFQPTTAVAAQGIEYLKQVFLPDASQADVIVGYRADDSYFSFARAFVNNAISIDQLAEAMRLGELGNSG